MLQGIQLNLQKSLGKPLNTSSDISLATVIMVLFTQRAVIQLTGFTDADWGGDLDDRKSTSGYIFKLEGGPVSWCSKKQSCVALSTSEAEYIALTSAAQEGIWLQQLISELLRKKKDKILIYEDNQSAICLAKNPQFHGRSKQSQLNSTLYEIKLREVQFQSSTVRLKT